MPALEPQYSFNHGIESKSLPHPHQSFVMPVTSNNEYVDTDNKDFLANLVKMEKYIHRENLEILNKVRPCASFSSSTTSSNRWLMPKEDHEDTNISHSIQRTAINPVLYRALTVGNANEFREAVSASGNSLSDFACPEGNTVLHTAANLGQEELIPVILSEDKNLIKAKNSRGDLAFHVAARAGHLTVLVWLLNWVLYHQDSPSSSSRNAVQSDEATDDDMIAHDIIGEKNHSDQNTALHIALENHQEMMASHLVYIYAAPSYSLNAEGISPLYLAIKAGYWGLVKYMIQRQPITEDMACQLLKGKSVVHAAIKAKRKDILVAILDGNEVLIDSTDEEGRTPISCAAYTGYFEGVCYLLEKFPDHIFKPNRNGSFPIHSASSGGHIEVVKKIFSIFPYTRYLLNRKGQNILHVAAESGKSKLLAYLIKVPQHERLINLKDHRGNTPLHLATKGKHPKVVYTLTQDKRVHLELQNKAGFAALDCALEYDGTQPSYEERLTWLALMYAGAKSAPRTHKSSKQKFSHGTLNMDNYKERVNTLLLVATLIATVTFAAGLNVPGGYNQSEPDIGMAVFSKNAAFQAFVISNTIAMYSALLVAIILIWAQLGDLKLIILSLGFALPLLGISLTMMSVAFMVGVHLTITNMAWLAISILVMGSCFLFTLLLFFIPLNSPSSIKSQILRSIFYIPLRMMLLLVSED